MDNYPDRGGNTDPNVLSGPRIKPKQISRLRWLQDRVKVGEPATLEFYYQGFEGGEAVTIRVLEYNGDGNHQEIDLIESTIPTAIGLQHMAWTIETTEAENLLVDEQNNDQIFAFIFDVNIDQTKTLLSGPALYLLADMELDLLDELDESQSGKTMHLLTQNKELHEAPISDGKVKFTNIVMGSYLVWVDPTQENESTDEI